MPIGQLRHRAPALPAQNDSLPSHSVVIGQRDEGRQNEPSRPVLIYETSANHSRTRRSNDNDKQ